MTEQQMKLIKRIAYLGDLLAFSSECGKSHLRVWIFRERMKYRAQLRNLENNAYHYWH